MGNSVGVLIPDGCKQIYIFDTEENFLEQINAGRMQPLYGYNEEEKSFVPAFIAYIPTVNH